MCVKAGGYTEREHTNNVLIDFLKDYGFSEASYLREGNAKNIDTTAKNHTFIVVVKVSQRI